MSCEGGQTELRSRISGVGAEAGQRNDGDEEVERRYGDQWDRECNSDTNDAGGQRKLFVVTRVQMPEA